MFGIHPADGLLNQPAALLQRREEVSLVLVDNVHNLGSEKQRLLIKMTTSCSVT